MSVGLRVRDSKADRGAAVSPSLLSPIAAEIHAQSVQYWGPHKAVTIVGESQATLKMLEKIRKIAAFDEPVLITGESGAGKESVAQALALLSDRCDKPFVPVNCPQYQEGNLAGSQFFGHVKGSFTGAVSNSKGVFETADGGVLFLDEIGDLPMGTQVMLLRALASGEFYPIGSTEARRVNIRFTAATNRSIEALRWKEQFRDDLYFRLSYFRIRVPPLRDRGDDWLLLIDATLHNLSKRYGVRKYFSKESIQILSGYSWPGNIRELLSLVTMSYAMSDGECIEPPDFIHQLDVQPRSEERPEDRLWRRMQEDRESFWNTVHPAFMKRDLNRTQVKEIIQRGLIKNGGNYKALLQDFNMPAEDYQRFMDFLRHHDLKP